VAIQKLHWIQLPGLLRFARNDGENGLDQRSSASQHDALGQGPLARAAET